MKNLFIFGFILILSINAFSQQITNADFEVIDKKFVVSYNITGVKKGQKFDVTLWYSLNGSSFQQINSNITGDYGTITAYADGSITGKKITWNALATQKNLKGKLQFDVRANVTNAFPSSMVLISAKNKTFTMGSPSNEPNRYDDETQHQVTFTYDFYMGKYEVTQKEYNSLMGTNPSYFKGDNLPVEEVTWFDAIKYCNALSKKEGISVAYNESTGDLLDANGNKTTDITKVKGYRLPTEAEWEYVARGGVETRQGVSLTYAGSYNIDEVAWYWDNAGKKTHQVGTKSPNALGLYDMSGNVWEWCSDWYGTYSSSSQTNPTGVSSGSSRVIRGGSWNNNASHCRVADRNYNTPSYSSSDIGFRVCREY